MFCKRATCIVQNEMFRMYLQFIPFFITLYLGTEKYRLKTVCVGLSSNSPDSEYSRRINVSVNMENRYFFPCIIDLGFVFGLYLNLFFTIIPPNLYKEVFNLVKSIRIILLTINLFLISLNIIHI